MFLIDPLADPRWAAFVAAHPRTCAFHTSGWLRALEAAYGYRPLVVTSSAPHAQLTDGILLCRVHSWATGRRLVSLPFSDHCDPLIAGEEIAPFTAFFSELVACENYKFVELRPATAVPEARIGEQFRSAEYCIHWLDLSQSIADIFKSLDKDSIQRKIRRADREKLEYREGRSADIIDIFYALLLRTRRRHHLPPQPKKWFRVLADCMGDGIQYRVALKDGAPAAAIVTLSHSNSMIYKYGCSDERYHATGAMPFLYWRMIQDAKAVGVPLVDFGRSDLDNPGLIRFKEQWGTRRTELKYYRFPVLSQKHRSAEFVNRAAKSVFSRLPDTLLETLGRLIYRHIG